MENNKSGAHQSRLLTTYSIARHQHENRSLMDVLVLGEGEARRRVYSRVEATALNIQLMGISALRRKLAALRRRESALKDAPGRRSAARRRELAHTAQVIEEELNRRWHHPIARAAF